MAGAGIGLRQPLHDCNYLQIDSRTGSEHNLCHVFGRFYASSALTPFCLRFDSIFEQGSMTKERPQ
jgi:hypothetical protein